MPPKRPTDVQSVDLSDSDDGDHSQRRLRSKRPRTGALLAPTPGLPPDQEQWDDIQIDLRELQHRSATHDHRFATIEASLATITTALTGNQSQGDIIRETPPTQTAPVRTTPVQGAKTLTGMAPGDAMQSLFPWVDKATLRDIVAFELDAGHLIKLIPPELRPKGQVTAGTPGSWVFDLASGKTTPVSETVTSYGKQFPDASTLIHALSVYSTIRQLYDDEGHGFGIAFAMLVRQLAIWGGPTPRFPWAAVLNYTIALFRKYQANPDPQKWIDIDIQLFAEHISQAPNTQLRASGKKRSDACANFNSRKGCTWERCFRPHTCESCGSKGHPAFECKGEKQK